MDNRKLYFFGGVSATDQGHGGETIKNGIILDYLQNSGFLVKILDTVKGKKNKAIFLASVMWSLLSPNKRKIVLSAATVSAVKYLKLAKYLNIHKKEIFYFVIGGTLSTRVKKGEVSAKLLGIPTEIFVEAKAMVNDLLEEGILNVKRIPNFKPIPNIFRRDSEDGIGFLKLVYVSRIMEEKGVLVLIEALRKLNSANLNVTLDFFGPIEKKFEEKFFNAIANLKNAEYQGILDFAGDKSSYEQLSAYHLKLLPTFHYGEGFPGVFIDCFISGVPVVTTKWNYNEEVIQDNENGLLIESASVDEVFNIVSQLISNSNKLNYLSEKAKESAKLYDVNTLLTPVFDKIYN